MKCRRCQSEVALGVPICPNCQAEQDHFVERVLGEYRLERRIGQGAFGWVYAARELSSGREVAIKLLRVEHASLDPKQGSLIQRFRQEATFIKRLEHPDAVKIYSTGETEDGLFWIAMELLDGDTLNALIHERVRLPIEECLTLLDSVFEVLHEAHQKGIIHRDLKPENLMVLRTGTTKILDFGISKAAELDSLTQTGTALGTPAYMPKEQWEGCKTITPAADIYSLGIILYKTLSGSFPFEANSAATWMNRHCMTEPTPLYELLPGCSASLNAVVMRSLNKDPNQRYQDALSFRDDLHKALRAEPISAPPIIEEPILSLEVPVRSEVNIGQTRSSELSMAMVVRQALMAPAVYSEPVAPVPRSSSWVWIVFAFLGLLLSGIVYLLVTRVPKPTPLSPPSQPLVASTQSVPVVALPTTRVVKTPTSAPTSKPSQQEQWLVQASRLAKAKKWKEAANLALKAKKKDLAAQYKKEEKAQNLLLQCEKSVKKKKSGIDSAFFSCSKIEQDTKAYEENQALVAATREAFKKKHYAIAKLAISEENLSLSRREIYLLQPFAKEKDIEVLQFKYFTLEQTCKRRILRVCK
jgi:serine/threonine protein kinase